MFAHSAHAHMGLCPNPHASIEPHTHTHTRKREDGVTLGHRAAEVCLLRIALEGMSFPNYGLH